MKITSKVVAALVLAGALAITVTTPAAAAETTFGPKSCVQGTLYTQAKTTQISIHTLKQGGQVYSRDFKNSSTPVVNKWYSGLFSTTGGSIWTNGSLANPILNCAD